MKETFIELLKEASDSFNNELDKEHDYILATVSIFNVGATISFESMDYSEEVEQEANDNGNLFCDKDSFIELMLNI